MNKILTFTFCLVAILLPVMGFAQTDSDYSNLLQFLKGDGAFEKWFMEIFYQIRQQCTRQCGRVSFG